MVVSVRRNRPVLSKTKLFSYTTRGHLRDGGNSAHSRRQMKILLDQTNRTSQCKIKQEETSAQGGLNSARGRKKKMGSQTKIALRRGGTNLVHLKGVSGRRTTKGLIKVWMREVECWASRG